MNKKSHPFWMERISVYRELCAIRPKGQEDRKPIYQPSVGKIMFNRNQLKLYYKKEFGVYAPIHKGGGSFTGKLGLSGPSVLVVTGHQFGLHAS